MKTLTQTDITNIIEGHRKWLAGKKDGARADLRDADLRGADLRGATLRGADLRCADLRGATLTDADLRGADLTDADLRGADLRGADLADADLTDAVNVKLVIACTRILPEGSLIGWKKCQDNVIAKLRIPEDSPRSHAFGRKCRCKFAEVLEVIGAPIGLSVHQGNGFTYEAGKRVQCDKWDEDFKNECSGGIHFFITREEAEAYCPTI